MASGAGFAVGGIPISFGSPTGYGAYIGSQETVLEYKETLLTRILTTTRLYST